MSRLPSREPQHARTQNLPNEPENGDNSRAFNGLSRRTLLGALGAAALAPRLAAAEAVSLFNGQDLTGWSVQQGPESSFFVDDGNIVIHPGGNYPTWLRYDRPLENFDFACEFFPKGWANSGIYLHAPLHGPAIYSGFKINLFQSATDHPTPSSMGAIFPVLAPTKVNVREGQWNKLRIRLDWPQLQVWSNGEMVQDVNVESHPELRHRLRQGYLGIESLSYPLRFRNLTLTALPDKDPAVLLYSQPSDFAKHWHIAEPGATWETIGPVLRSDGLGYLATNESYSDFALEMYVRASRFSNGGVYFRLGPEVAGKGISARDHYEIQIHDVEGANYATGSLYYTVRGRYPRIQPEEWYLFQLIAQGQRCITRINGETIVDADKLERTTASPILIQAHKKGSWLEYKQIRVRRL